MLGQELEFARDDARRARPSPPSFVRVDVGTLAIPGSLRLPGGAVLGASLTEGGGQARSTSGGESTAALDAGRVSGPLRVRFRLLGDRIQPLGLDGHKKLQDLFVDRKVPRQERDTVPLVLDADGRIVWVAGHVIAHQARVTASTASVLLLHYRR